MRSWPLLYRMGSLWGVKNRECAKKSQGFNSVGNAVIARPWD